MKKLMLVGFALLAALSVETASAAAAKGGGSAGGGGGGGHKWGMAGCDLWATVITDKGQWPQLGVYLLRNVILNVQTFAISSGTSNCVADRTKVGQVEEREVFVAANLTELSKEAAQGTGAHLTGLAQLLGCSDADAFARVSQQQHGDIFVASDPDLVLNNYLNAVKSNKELAQSCSSAI